MGVSKEDFKALEHRMAVLEGQLNTRIDTVRNGLQSISVGVAQNLAALKANLDVNADGLEQLDIFNRIWAKVLIRSSMRQAQFQYLIDNNLKLEELKDNDLAVIKEQGNEWFEATFVAMKAEVVEEREAYLKELRAKAAEIQSEQEKAAKEAEQAKKEGEVAEEALRGAGQGIAALGGHGSEIPAGVQVFGGE